MDSNSNPEKLVKGANIVAPGHNCRWYFYANFPPKCQKFLPLYYLIAHHNSPKKEKSQRCFIIINHKDVCNDNNCYICHQALCFAFISSFKPHNNFMSLILQMEK